MARFTNIFRLLLIGATLVTASSCVRRPALAETSSLSEFDGEWVGEYSWKKGNWVTLEIQKGKINLVDFPSSHASTGEVVESGASTVEFHSEWSTKAPCVVLTLPGSKLLVPLYMTKTKQGLYYEYSTRPRKRILFLRKDARVGTK